eukprot:365515-Chlamydomonas_euryale.AAC.7
MHARTHARTLRFPPCVTSETARIVKVVHLPGAGGEQPVLLEPPAPGHRKLGGNGAGCTEGWARVHGDAAIRRRLTALNSAARSPVHVRAAAQPAPAGMAGALPGVQGASPPGSLSSGGFLSGGLPSRQGSVGAGTLCGIAGSGGAPGVMDMDTVLQVRPFALPHLLPAPS